jgi:mono/diheme cytochrome c family protein
MEDLLQQLAEAKGMPASLVERSAQARAKATGQSTDDVLREWAVEEGVAGATAPATPEPASAPVTSEPSPAGAVAGGLSGAALLDAVAEARGMPASLVERSAGARAKKTGGSTDDVLREWAVEAGIEVGAAPAAATSAAAAPEPGVVAAIVEPADEPVGAVSVEVFEPTAAVPAAEGPEAADETGSRRRYPVLLAAAMVLIPLMAVLYLVVVPNGPSCGSSGQLAVDPVSGEAVGCDGAEYGGGEVNSFAAGEEIYQANCAVCHAAEGTGGAGPAMSGGAVLATFPEDACVTQIEWVALGSSGWPDATYGADAKPVIGGMPGFEGSLIAEELAQVILYERVAFGGEDLATAEAECGLMGDAADGETESG